MSYLLIEESENGQPGRALRFKDASSALAHAKREFKTGVWTLIGPDGSQVRVPLGDETAGAPASPPPFAHHALPPKGPVQTRSAERRAHTRHSHQFRVILVSGNRTFRSMTHDISLGGIKLENELPAGFLRSGKSCQILVGGADLHHNLQLECELIPEASGAGIRRVKFKELASDGEALLLQWLEHAQSSNAA